MTVEVQYADGSYGGIRELDALQTWRSGGYMGPAGSNQPAFFGGFTLAFNVGGGTDTAGGILSYQNNFGFDLMIISHQLDVSTQSSGVCTVSFGETPTSGTTLASNMLSGQTVAAVGTFNGGSLSVKWPQGKWITGSTASGASTGLVARVLVSCLPMPAAGAK